MLPTKTRSFERTQFLADVLTTAIEGGINYWGAVSTYKWYSPTLEGGTAEHLDGMPNAYATVHEEDPDTEDGYAETGVAVGLEDIARGIGVIRRNEFPKHEGISAGRRATILEASDENDAGEIDADLADCIVQAAMFGKIVYG